MLIELQNKIVLGELCAWHEAEEAAAKLQQSGEERDIGGNGCKIEKLVSSALTPDRHQHATFGILVPQVIGRET